jgi:hypothetical protein
MLILRSFATFGAQARRKEFLLALPYLGLTHPGYSSAAPSELFDKAMHLMVDTPRRGGYSNSVTILQGEYEEAAMGIFEHGWDRP